MQFSLEHRFDIDRETYMAEVYFNKEMGRQMDQALGLGSKELIEEVDDEAIYKRVNMVRPQRDLPRALRKVLGDKGLGFFETTIHYKGEFRLEWKMKTEMMPDRIFGGGEILILDDNGATIRRVSGEINAKIFGVGGMIEKTSVENVRESYDKAAAITSQWIADHHKA